MRMSIGKLSDRRWLPFESIIFSIFDRCVTYRKKDRSIRSCLMNLVSPFHRPGGSADKGFGVFAVEVEEEFQPFQFRLEGRRAVTEIHGGVQSAVGGEELLRHGVGIVEIG